MLKSLTSGKRTLTLCHDYSNKSPLHGEKLQNVTEKVKVRKLLSVKIPEAYMEQRDKHKSQNEKVPLLLN